GPAPAVADRLRAAGRIADGRDAAARPGADVALARPAAAGRTLTARRATVPGLARYKIPNPKSQIRRKSKGPSSNDPNPRGVGLGHWDFKFGISNWRFSKGVAAGARR